MRRKERLLGIWANRTSREFAERAVLLRHASQREFQRRRRSGRSSREYRLGVTSLPFVQDGGDEATAQLFAKALIDLKTRARPLSSSASSAVEFLAPNVFRTTFFLPSDIPTGEYRVSVYLFRGDAFLAGQTQTLTIEKGGFSERIARAADDQPLALRARLRGARRSSPAGSPA